VKKANKWAIKILKLFADNFRDKRQVTHWFYFENYTNLEQFEIYINEIGYNTLTKDLENEKVFDEYLLIVHRIEIISEDSINFDTLDFLEKASEFNGIYDGWETRVK